MTTDWDRRSFLRRTAVIAGIFLTPVAQLIRPAGALAARKIRPFRFIHADTVAIVLDYAKSAHRYDLTVRQEGQEVQFFPGADPTRFDRLDSEYFTVEYGEAAA